MDDKIKEPEKMNENKKIQQTKAEKIASDEEVQEVNAEDLDNVSGGGVFTTVSNKFREVVQRLKMSKEERKEIIFLLNSYNNRDFMSPRMMYGGQDYFKGRRAIVEKLKVYAKKYPNIPELKPFLD